MHSFYGVDGKQGAVQAFQGFRILGVRANAEQVLWFDVDGAAVA